MGDWGGRGGGCWPLVKASAGLLKGALCVSVCVCLREDFWVLGYSTLNPNP